MNGCLFYRVQFLGDNFRGLVLEVHVEYKGGNTMYLHVCFDIVITIMHY